LLQIYQDEELVAQYNATKNKLTHHPFAPRRELQETNIKSSLAQRRWCEYQIIKSKDIYVLR